MLLIQASAWEASGSVVCFLFDSLSPRPPGFAGRRPPEQGTLVPAKTSGEAACSSFSAELVCPDLSEPNTWCSPFTLQDHHSQ